MSLPTHPLSKRRENAFNVRVFHPRDASVIAEQHKPSVPVVLTTEFETRTASVIFFGVRFPLHIHNVREAGITFWAKGISGPVKNLESTRRACLDVPGLLVNSVHV